VKTAHACSLTQGQAFSPGQFDDYGVASTIAVTPSCVFIELIYQNDGNFVLYRKPNWPSSTGQSVLWATGTQNTSHGHVIFQNDGNLVVYDGSGQARWASNTNGQGATLLYLQSDGNLVIYRNSTPLWASNTCCQA
jgi:hypothetical protein